MVLEFLKNRTQFDTHYHQRSIVEAVFAALKERRGRGGSLRSRRTSTQNRELAVQVISYNIDMVSRKAVEEGRLTKDHLEAMSKAKPEDIRAYMDGRFTKNALMITAAG